MQKSIRPKTPAHSSGVNPLSKRTTSAVLLGMDSPTIWNPLSFISLMASFRPGTSSKTMQIRGRPKSTPHCCNFCFNISLSTKDKKSVEKVGSGTHSALLPIVESSHLRKDFVRVRWFLGIVRQSVWPMDTAYAILGIFILSSGQYTFGKAGHHGLFCSDTRPKNRF